MTISEILNKIDERKNYINNWIENPEPDEWHFLEELQTDLSAISEGTESLAKQAQQEIAEQIIEDIPKYWRNIDEQGISSSKLIKDQLRKKYLTKL